MEGGGGAIGAIGVTGALGSVDSDTAGIGAASDPDAKHDLNSPSLIDSFFFTGALFGAATHHRRIATVLGSCGGIIQVSEFGLLDC